MIALNEDMVVANFGLVDECGDGGLVDGGDGELVEQVADGGAVHQFEFGAVGGSLNFQHGNVFESNFHVNRVP